MDEIRAQLQLEVEALKKWKEALINEAVITWTLSKENSEDPKRMLNDIVNWHVQVALDPKVSAVAAAWETKIKTLTAQNEIFIEALEKTEQLVKDCLARLTEIANDEPPQEIQDHIEEFEIDEKKPNQ